MKVVGNMTIVGTKGLLSCNGCGHEFNYKDVGHSGSANPANINDKLQVLDTAGAIIRCPGCQEPWTLEYMQRGNMGFRDGVEYTHIKCHCQHKFKVPYVRNDEVISCPDCNCTWKNEPEWDRKVTPFKFFLAYVTVNNEEQAICVGQEHDLLAFAAINSTRILEQTPKATAIRFEEISREIAIEYLNKRHQESFFEILTLLLLG